MRRRAICCLLAVFLGTLALLGVSHEGIRLWVLFGVLSIASALATPRRCGWLIPCFVIGVTFGVFSDPLLKGGTIESQMWETVHNIVFGAVLGLMIGTFVDLPSLVKWFTGHD